MGFPVQIDMPEGVLKELALFADRCCISEELTRLSGRQMRDRRRLFQFIFQDPYSSLNPRKSIGSIITLPLKVQGDPNPGTWRRRAEEMERQRREAEYLAQFE